MIKTYCGMSKNQFLVKPVINHDMINIANKKHVRYFLLVYTTQVNSTFRAR